MRGLLLALWGLVSWGSAWAQASARPSLAAVHSVRQAQYFMRSLGGDFAAMELDSLLLDEQERCAWYQIHPADTIAAADLDSCARYAIPRPTPWVKADFDQDGQPDLLVNAGYGRVYCVLNRGAQPPLVVPVADGRRSSRDCYAVEVIQLAGRPAIAHVQVHGISAHRRAEGYTTARQDTLVYHLGAFVEYNPRPSQPPPRKLGFRYRLGGPPKPDPGYDLTINLKTGRVKSYARLGYKHVQGAYSYRLRAGTLDTLRRQVAYVPVARLDSEYALSAYDASSYDLTFYPQHQPPKLVEDYGGDGPYALQRLYRLLTTAHDQEMERRWQRLQARGAD